jgi:peptidoglycan hydrolase-like protein with peptidoglycan-binding domain/DNA invertase Pin-like site-specific DNA recombinase
MTRRHYGGGTRAPAATILVCLALLGVPAVSVAADPGDAGGAADRATAPLGPGAGYGQPRGEPQVRALQRRLRALGLRPGPVDGRYGPLTAEAVERLQRDGGLAVDGIVGTQTRRVLNAAAPPLAPGAGYGQPGGSMRVRVVQRQLRSLGHRPGPVDGLYGPRTRAAVERFQRTVDRPTTGVVSPAVAVALARSERDRASAPADRAGRDSGPAAGPTQTAGAPTETKTRWARQTDVSTEATGEGGPSFPLSWAAAALALLVLGGLLATLARRRRGRPEASGAPVVGVTPTPPPSNGRAPVKETGSRRPPRDAALGYLSVREPEQASGQEVQDQIAAIEAACRHRGLELTEVVRDSELVAATAPERPGMQHAMDRLAAGGASCMVVAELDRLSRSAPEVGSIVESLRRRETRLVAAGEELDTSTRSGSKAADELVSRSAAGDRPARGRAGSGSATRTPRPTKRASHRPPPDEHVPALQERIRAMRASGMTLQAIADRLNAENVPTLRGGVMWRPSSVQAAAGYRRPREAAAARPDLSGAKAGGSRGKGRGKSRRASRRRGGVPR